MKKKKEKEKSPATELLTLSQGTITLEKSQNLDKKQQITRNR